MKKKVVPTLRQEVKVKVDIITSDDIKIYYTGKFQDFTARYIINFNISLLIIYLSAIETLICHTEIEVDRVYFHRFCTKYKT